MKYKENTILKMKYKENTILTYRELVSRLEAVNKQFPSLDVYDQPVTLLSPDAVDEYYNISELFREPDGHFTLVA